MRKQISTGIIDNENIRNAGDSNTRLNNLIDAVFGIAITLLIFNVSDANSFSDLLVFAKSFPALVISILFLYLIWKEHVVFSRVFTIKSNLLQLLNIIFIALILFYVYPLRFLTKLLTNIYFQTNINIQIIGEEVPELMIYYGLVTFAIYFVLCLFYVSVKRNKKNQPMLNEHEVFYTKGQISRLCIMFSVPLLSAILCLIIKGSSIVLASILGGCVYGLYPILIYFWSKKYD